MKDYQFSPATAELVTGEVTIPKDLLDQIASDVREFDKTYSAAEKSARSLAVIERTLEGIGRDSESLSGELRQTIRGLTIAVQKLVDLMNPAPTVAVGYTGVTKKTTPDPSA